MRRAPTFGSDPNPSMWGHDLLACGRCDSKRRARTSALIKYAHSRRLKGFALTPGLARSGLLASVHHPYTTAVQFHCVALTSPFSACTKIRSARLTASLPVDG
jgi:hypothetical protein